MTDQSVVLVVSLSVAAVVLLLLLSGLTLYCLWKRKDQRHYQELLNTTPSLPSCTAPLVLVSPGSWTTPSEIPFTLPPRFSTQTQVDLKSSDGEGPGVESETKMEAQRDILAHRGSLSVRSWFPLGTVLAGLYSVSPLNPVVAPPPGLSTRLCFSVEYRHSSERLLVSLLRLGNLPPRFHSNQTLVELRLLPDDRRPQQAKARCTGPDPEFNDCVVFQVSAVCVPGSSLSVSVLSVSADGRRQAVGRVLFPLQGELGQAGRVLWRDLETDEEPQCSELGDVQVSLSYSPSLQKLCVGVTRARGLQLVTDTGVCVQVTLQIQTQLKSKRSSVQKGESDPCFNHRNTFKLRPQQLDQACVRLQVQQPLSLGSEPCVPLGVLVLGPFMFARGPQLQHWMDTVNAPQETLDMWHPLGRPA